MQTIAAVMVNFVVIRDKHSFFYVNILDIFFLIFREYLLVFRLRAIFRSCHGFSTGRVEAARPFFAVIRAIAFSLATRCRRAARFVWKRAQCAFRATTPTTMHDEAEAKATSGSQALQLLDCVSTPLH